MWPVRYSKWNAMVKPKAVSSMNPITKKGAEGLRGGSFPRTFGVRGGAMALASILVINQR